VNRTVLINAGPWLPVPPGGYGGIENVLAALIPELRRRGVRVVLATVAASTLAVEERISVYPDPQFDRIAEPYNRVMGVAAAHLQRIVTELRRRDDIDLVHDHLEALGPTVLAAAGPDAPPVLHTLHWDLHKHPELYGAFDGGGRVFVNGVSASQLARAPAALRAHSVGHVHLATPLAEGATRRPLPAKGDHFVVLGRITACKGQHIAARLAHRAGIRLVLAGPVGPYRDPAALAAARTTEPVAHQHPDVRYWYDGHPPRGREPGAVGRHAPRCRARRARGHRPGNAVARAVGRTGRHRDRRVTGPGDPGDRLPPRLPARAPRRAHRAARRPGRRGGTRRARPAGGQAAPGGLPAGGRAALQPGHDGRGLPPALRHRAGAFRRCR